MKKIIKDVVVYLSFVSKKKMLKNIAIVYLLIGVVLRFCSGYHDIAENGFWHWLFGGASRFDLVIEILFWPFYLF
jgi:hypothetical protein